MFLEPVDKNEIISIFSEINNSTSCDVNDIQIRPVKYVIDVISDVLAYLYNLCLQSAQFPSNMQIAKVTVLHKKGDKNDFSNYRPISILPVFSKGLEKVILRRIEKFCEANDIITDCQYGFRKNRSTELALLHQKEHILECFEQKKIVLGIFVDYTKAFDRINHEILFQKLELYGIRGHALLLIKSYLSSRTQYVQIDQFKSSSRHVVCGVPQGSILGPLLFNIYINDIVKIDKVSRFIIYADDTSIFISNENPNDVITQVNNLLQKLEKWSDENVLSVNVSKSKAIIFHPRNKRVTVSANLLYHSSVLEIVSSFKSLGVYF